MKHCSLLQTEALRYSRLLLFEMRAARAACRRAMVTAAAGTAAGITRTVAQAVANRKAD
ncbi:MAG: hypothetical protein HXK84_06050 [Lachnospiraceae bacterium]|nr:hypothetical protein [Lachnospiraceae bacterium]